MTTHIADPILERDVIAQRQANGSDRWDEVWEGVYVLMPMPNDEHQVLVLRLGSLLDDTVGIPLDARVRPSVNMSDRIEGWNTNYRCPDLVVYLRDSDAECHDTFWFGGPDFAIEIVSPRDRTRQKLDFYASIGMQELLIIDRDPWSLELLQLRDGELRPVGRAQADGETVLRSEIVPLTFQLAAGDKRPSIIVTHHDDDQNWSI